MPDNSSYFEQQKKLLEEEKFNNSIALTNARDNALRTTQANMQAQGFAGTGYGLQMQSDVNNAYLSQQATSNNDYWARLQDLNQAENEANQANASDALASISQLASEQNSINPFIQNGVVVGREGNYSINMNSDYVKMMTDADRIQLQATIDEYNNPIQGGRYASVEDLYNASGYDLDENPNPNLRLDDGTWGVKNELDTFNTMFKNGQVKDGDMVRLRNSHDGARGTEVYVFFKNGRFYTMNREQAQAAMKRYNIKSYRQIVGSRKAASSKSFNGALPESSNLDEN